MQTQMLIALLCHSTEAKAQMRADPDWIEAARISEALMQCQAGSGRAEGSSWRQPSPEHMAAHRGAWSASGDRQTIQSSTKLVPMKPAPPVTKIMANA